MPHNPDKRATRNRVREAKDEIQAGKKVSCFVLTVLAIICIEMSLVSWFVQLKRIFAICLFISLMWYWIYLYKPNAVTTKIHCDAEVNLSKQMLAEIQKLVNKDSSWRNASLEDALSKILIDFKHHDHESSRNWRFEDTFGVEPDMVIKIAYAEQQAKLAMMENLKDKCTGVKKLDWMDNIKDVNRSIGDAIFKTVHLALIHLDTCVRKPSGFGQLGLFRRTLVSNTTRP
ncbi:chloride channel CLIC-like protein 1 isoform X5 [Silurus meridionalis]|uniref:chloride channel CLIC-like protein 1 isoform X5 n=1 Tax=Silurus meridionalis TaxID=175797 RepID=UPI001EEBF280|nr:chloride channel CLIC-like protein 1 isoform X5 [Silurus meridionalis]